MRAAFLLWFALIVSQAPPPVPSSADNGSVEGTVTWASRALPLEGIPVYLSKDGENVATATRRGLATTDATGKFALKDVTPGNYTVTFSRQGYYLQGDQPIRVSVAPKQQVKDVAMKMIVGGSISGRIDDISGLPLAGVNVAASPASQGQVQALGTSQLMTIEVFSGSGRGGTTDDRGEFRLWGLRPGSYLVQGDVSMWASDSLTYYPGVKERSAAIAVTVREAEDIRIGFQMEARLKPVFAISGVVVGSVPGVVSAPVPHIWVSTKSGSTYYDNRAADRSNGRFEIRNIFPDSYDLLPEVVDANGRMYTSRTPVEVMDRNIENVVLRATPTLDIKGRVVIDNDAPRGRLGKLNLRLSSPDGREDFLFFGQSNAGFSRQQIVVDPDSGDFSIQQVIPGTYTIGPTGSLPQDAYIEDVRLGLQSAVGGLILADQTVPPIEVVIGMQGGKADGVVRNAKRETVAGAVIGLVPEGVQRQDRSRFRNVRTNSEGKFSLRGIAPGVYRVFAWENEPSRADYFDAEFLKKHETRGQLLSVGSGSSLTLQLDLIPKDGR